VQKDASNNTFSLIKKKMNVSKAHRDLLKISYYAFINVPIAQLDRALRYGTKGSASRTFRD